MRGRRGGPLKLIQTLRGEGAVTWAPDGHATVAYTIDLYSQGERITGDGAIRGELSGLMESALESASLRLADGVEVQVALSELDPDEATIELDDAAVPITLRKTRA